MPVAPIPVDPYAAAFAAFAPGINAAAAGGIFSDHDQLASGGTNSLGDNWTVSTGGGTASATNGVPAAAQGLAALPALAGLPATVGGIKTTYVMLTVLALLIVTKKKRA